MKFLKKKSQFERRKTVFGSFSCCFFVTVQELLSLKLLYGDGFNDFCSLLFFESKFNNIRWKHLLYFTHLASAPNVKCSAPLYQELWSPKLSKSRQIKSVWITTFKTMLIGTDKTPGMILRISTTISYAISLVWEVFLKLLDEESAQWYLREEYSITREKCPGNQCSCDVQ